MKTEEELNLEKTQAQTKKLKLECKKLDMQQQAAERQLVSISVVETALNHVTELYASIQDEVELIVLNVQSATSSKMPKNKVIDLIKEMLATKIKQAQHKLQRQL